MIMLLGYQMNQGVFHDDEKNRDVPYDTITAFLGTDEKPDFHGLFVKKESIPRKGLTIAGANSLDDMLNKPVSVSYSMFTSTPKINVITLLK